MSIWGWDLGARGCAKCSASKFWRKYHWCHLSHQKKNKLKLGLKQIQIYFQMHVKVKFLNASFQEGNSLTILFHISQNASSSSKSRVGGIPRAKRNKKHDQRQRLRRDSLPKWRVPDLSASKFINFTTLNKKARFSFLPAFLKLQSSISAF